MQTIKIENIREELLAIRVLEGAELRRKWRFLLGSEPPPFSAQLLRKKLAYKLQERCFGGLTESDRKKLEVIGDAPKPRRNPAGITVGTILEREWKGQKYVVVAREDGFELEGRHYRSLSGAALAITGTSWNGKKFFGVTS